MTWLELIAVAVISYWVGKFRAIKQIDKAYKEGRLAVVEPTS